MSQLEPAFPLEFLVHGTPVSHQRQNPRARDEWKEIVRAASMPCLPESHFAVERQVAVTLFYFPDEKLDGDLDNIIKYIIDALSAHIYVDDRQVERILIQKFEPGRIFSFSSPSETLLRCMTVVKPSLYVRVSDDPHEGRS